jgi:hypothetical protein
MPTECTDTLDSGAKCQAPARNGSSFCHHHNPRPHLDPRPRETREREPLVLPALQDKCAILVAVSEVIHAASERRIKCSEARTLLMALKFASRLMTEIDQTGVSSSDAYDGQSYAKPSYEKHPPQPAPSPQLAPGLAHQLTPSELDGFVHTLQNATVQQLRRQSPQGAEPFTFKGARSSDHAPRLLSHS